MATKKLKANDILNISKQEYTYKQISVTASTGQEFTVQIQEKLNDTSIANLVTDLVRRSKFCDEKEIEFNIVQNIYFLLLKYFTDIQFNSYKSLEKQYLHELQVVAVLIDLKLFDQILNQFDKETLNKIQESFDKFAKQLKPVINNEIKNEIIKADEL